MNIISLILLSFVLILFETCTPIESETKELINTTWVLEEIEFSGGGGGMTPSVNENYEIRFNSDKTLVGKKNCNDIFGTYTSDSLYIDITELTTTEKNCNLGQGNFFEKSFFDGLKMTHRYSIDEKLSLYYNAGGSNTLIFKKK